MGFSDLMGKLTKRWHPLPAPITTSWLLSSGLAGTGQNITPDVALSCAANLACISVISRSMAALPIKVQKIDDKTVCDHPLTPILNKAPNYEMTAASFWESFYLNTLLWGNGFSYIDYGEITEPGIPRPGYEITGVSGTNPVAIWPLRAGSTTPQRSAALQLYYSIITGSGSYSKTPQYILHVPDLSYDGITGLSRIRYGSSATGLALAMENFTSKFFANGGSVGGKVKLPLGMKPEAVKEFAKSFREHNSGNDNAFRTMMLTDGMDYELLEVMNARNAQVIDGKSFQVLEACRLWGVPPHKIASMTGSTFATVAAQNQDFIDSCLGGWATKVEQELDRKLLSETEKQTLEIKYDFSQLLRADQAARYTANNSAILAGWKTVNEVRAEEGLPAKPGADDLKQPLNMGKPGGDPANEPPKPGADPVEAEADPVEAEADPVEAEADPVEADQDDERELRGGPGSGPRPGQGNGKPKVASTVMSDKDFSDRVQAAANSAPANGAFGDKAFIHESHAQFTADPTNPSISLQDFKSRIVKVNVDHIELGREDMELGPDAEKNEKVALARTTHGAATFHYIYKK